MVSIALGLLCILAGSVWLAQGLDLPFAPGSFMTAEPAWIAIGAAFVVAGLAMVGSGLRRRSSRHGDR
jgi:hypothetical protein